MKRFYPLLLLLVVIALLGRTTVTAFAPELTYSAVVSDWAEESEDDDETGDDDNVFESVGDLIAVTLQSATPPVPLSMQMETLPRETFSPPPQA